MLPVLTERLKISLVYGITACFVLLNTYLIYREMFFGILIPLTLVLIFLYIFSLDKVLMLAVFATPLSINIGDYELGVSISLPSEPLLIGILFFLVLKILLEGGLERRILKHPVSLAILFYISVVVLTSITSDIPLVSFKFLVSRLWFIIPIYFGGLMLFRKKANLRLFAWLYVLALVIVIGYATVHHYSYSFSERAGHWVMQPFYNDHTAYGAILALMLPVFIGLSVDSTLKGKERLFSLLITAILFIGLFLSFSRAAWISVGFAFGVLLLVLLKIKFRWIVLTIGLLLAIFFTFKFEILDQLEKNKQDSSENFVEHIQSISNISSDASNLERINRWQAALRMFDERPLTGWGPGTYQFEYAPFQRAREKTIISTNLGDMGNAHSEYIGPLAEQGVLGLLAVLVLMVTVIYRGLKVYRVAKDKHVRILALSTTLGLITYYVHGIMNNFLDTDKLSVPFWGFFSIIVALDIYYSGKSDEELQTHNSKETKI